MKSSLLLFFLSFSPVTIFTLSTPNSATHCSQTTTSVASKFKAPHSSTPPEIASEWERKDKTLQSYIESNVPAVLEHTGAAAFDDHLRGVQSVLRYWGAEEHVASAGLFHSIYGTEGFQGFSLPLSERESIQNLIGTKAEKLCFVFCMVDRLTLDRTIFDWSERLDDNVNFTLRARPEMGRFEMSLTKEEWLDFVELTLADWLEQVEGAAQKPSEKYFWKTGDAYSHRRLAFAKMSQLLAVERHPRLTDVAPRMLREVMGTEGMETRHLVQMRTPPQSQAGINAWAALRAAGEDIPEDLRPQSIDDRILKSGKW